jgi:hypothetical protein
LLLKLFLKFIGFKNETGALVEINAVIFGCAVVLRDADVKLESAAPLPLDAGVWNVGQIAQPDKEWLAEDCSGAAAPFQCEMKASTSRFCMSGNLTDKSDEEQARQIFGSALIWIQFGQLLKFGIFQ